jgi:TonB-dependent receptor
LQQKNKGMRTIILLALALIFNSAVFAQKGKIEGKVTDANTGQPLAGVSVVDKATGKGVATTAEGRYILNVDGRSHSLVFSYNGVTQQVDGIEVTEGKVTTQDLAITPKTKTEEGVVVRATSTARKESASAIIAFQKNTNTVASVISAESIKRSPDRNTGEVLKRIPGASLQEGKFIVIRGLADRYNQAMLNGILLTSTEPDRKTFSFDLIPSSMIDNIVINKAFVPEYPGEWAGGLIQVNTKDIPAKNFFNIQLGTGFNTQTIGKDFYKDKGGKGEWLGIDDGTRGLPDGYTTKSEFDHLSDAQKTAIGKQMRNAWVGTRTDAPINTAVQLNGGFTGKLFGKKIGGNFGVNYSKNNNFIDLGNFLNKISSTITVENAFHDERYRQTTTAGVFGSLAFQLNQNHKISVKSIANINTSSSVTNRTGIDITRETGSQTGFITGSELSFKQNTFFTVQANGEHNLASPLKLKWYGAFNILDGHSPDQRRLTYDESTTGGNVAIISGTLSQQSGSRIFQSLNDYIYTAGGDLAYSFDMFNRKQTLKSGYMFQVKDRLYDAKLFAVYVPNQTAFNYSLLRLPANEIFAPENFGNGADDKFGFDALQGKTFRYLANTILNAGFLQLDNQFSNKIRVVWGARVEHYDQLVGSVKKSDPRHTYTKVLDVLPGINATYKINNKTNFRVSASQTVIRPELRELSYLNLYDFELNASVQGNPKLERTKISNFDLRYELYPRAGETFSIGAFYKYFNKPIEQLYNEGSGGSSTFTYQNPEKARAYGVEIEFRRKLDLIASALKNFTFQANGAYINSKMTDEKFNVDRALQGQSPYLFNIGLLYDHEQSGINATLLYNQIGERIYLVGDISAGAGSPDIYEAPRPLLDFQVSKKFLANKMEVKLNVSDILNKKQIFYQNTNDKVTYQKDEDLYRFTRKFGTSFGLTVNYAL